MTTATATPQAADFVYKAMDPIHGSHLDLEASELADILRYAAIEVNSDPDVVASQGLAPEPGLISVYEESAVVRFEDGSYLFFILIDGRYTDGMEIYDGITLKPLASY